MLKKPFKKLKQEVFFEKDILLKRRLYEGM